MLTRVFIGVAARLLAIGLVALPAYAQNAATPAGRPAQRVTGTVSAIDQANQTVTVKEDKTGTEYIVQLANTRTLLKVAPGAKDLNGATRISADDLAVGDRLQVGGAKTPDITNTIAARSVLLMSARDLERAHQAEAAAWQHSTPGVVTAVDPAAQKIEVTARMPGGPKPIVVDAAKARFTRYSPESPQTPASSQLADVQPGDQVRIIGEMNADGSSLAAQKIYSSSFRTVVGTVLAIGADGKEITIRNLQTKQPVTVALSEDSAVRRLPPMMAMALARRFNPEFRAAHPAAAASGGAGGSGYSGGADANAEHTGNTAGAPSYGAKAGEAGNGGASGAGGVGGNWSGGSGPGAGMHRAGNGDLSGMLDALPKISATDLKPGDAVVVSGSPSGADKDHLLATTVIAGVEPIFQSASPRQAQSLGDWGASLGGGSSGDMGGGAPGAPPQ